MSVYIQEVLGLLKRNKKKTKLDKQRDHFEFGKLYHTSKLNTGASYNPTMEPFVVKWGDIVCQATEDLTRTQPGSGKVGKIPVYTDPEGFCSWDTLMDSIMSQNAIGDTISIAGDLYVDGTITSTALTEDRIVIVGPNGILEDDANFTMDGTTFTANVNVAHGPTTMAPVPPHTTTINSNLFLEGPVYDSLGNMGGLNKVLVGLADGRVKWQDDDVVEALTYGALWQGDPTNYKVELPIGTADQILISDGTTFSWKDNPAAIVGEVCDVYRIPLWTPDSQTLGCSLLIQNGNSSTPATKITNDGKLQQTKELFLDTVTQDDTLTEVLVRDTGSANEVKFRDVSTIVPPVGFDTLTMSTSADWTQTYLNAYVPLDDTSVSYMRIGGMTGLTDGQEGHVIAENVKTGTLLAQDAIRFPDGWGVVGELWDNRVSWLTGPGGMNGYKDTDTLLFGESLKFKYINYQAPGQSNNVLFWDACCKLYSKNDCPQASNQTHTINEDTSLPSTSTVVVDNGYGGYGLTYTIVSNVTNGTLNFNLNTGVYTYTPNTNFFGTDQFTYTVSDGYCSSDVTTVTINVTAVPEAPEFTSPCPNTSSLIAGGTYTYNYTIVDPDHAGNQLTVTYELQDANGVNITGTSSDWLTNTYNNDYTGTITGTYPATGGTFTLILSVTDPDNLVGQQSCNIAGLIPDKDTFFNFWSDVSGSMISTISQTAQMASVSTVYFRGDAQQTGAAADEYISLNNGSGFGRVDKAQTDQLNAGFYANAHFACRVGMSVLPAAGTPDTFVDGSGNPTQAFIGSLNYNGAVLTLKFVDGSGNPVTHSMPGGVTLICTLPDSVKTADYNDTGKNFRNLLQDFYATAGTQASGNTDRATNGSDRYDSHVIWTHGGQELFVGCLSMKNGSLNRGTGSNPATNWFYDATQIFQLVMYDESGRCNGIDNGYEMCTQDPGSWPDRNSSTNALLVGDVAGVRGWVGVPQYTDAGGTTHSAVAGTLDPNVTFRATFFPIAPDPSNPPIDTMVGHQGAFALGVNANVTGFIYPGGVQTTVTTNAAAYDEQLETLTPHYQSTPALIRAYPTTQNASENNAYVLSDGAGSVYYYNAVRAALLNHGVTGI